MRIVCTTQDSNEWFAAKLCKIGAASIAAASQYVKKGSKERGDVRIVSGAKRILLIRALAWEMITRVNTDHYVSDDMDRGKQFEPAARRALSKALYGLPSEIERTGFILHPELDFLGASPDGYTIENGIWIPVELKVPRPETHKRYLEEALDTGDFVPEDYGDQTQCQMLVMDRAPYGRFASYCPPEMCPEMPDQFRLLHTKPPANPQRWAEMEESATATMEEATTLAKRLAERYPRAEEKEDPRSAYDQACEVADQLIDAP